MVFSIRCLMKIYLSVSGNHATRTNGKLIQVFDLHNQSISNVAWQSRACLRTASIGSRSTTSQLSLSHFRISKGRYSARARIPTARSIHKRLTPKPNHQRSQKARRRQRVSSPQTSLLLQMQLKARRRSIIMINNHNRRQRVVSHTSRPRRRHPLRAGRMISSHRRRQRSSTTRRRTSRSKRGAVRCMAPCRGQKCRASPDLQPNRIKISAWTQSYKAGGVQGVYHRAHRVPREVSLNKIRCSRGRQ